MMGSNRGKQFELRFKEDWIRSMSSCIDRIYDQVSGYKTVSNISDYIAFKYPLLFYLECKSTNEGTFNFARLTQYDKLVSKLGCEKGVRIGVVIWFVNNDRVIYVPIKTIKEMKSDGLKSVNIRTIDGSGYRFFDIPSKKLRVFMESDYSILTKTEEGD